MNSVTPTGLDVLCGKGGDCYNHEGNIHFRGLVSTLLPQYAEATCRASKTQTVRSIVSSVLQRGGRFLRKDKETGEWFDGGTSLAKKKVGHTLRDGCIELNKKKQRRADRPRRKKANSDSSDSSDSSAGSAPNKDSVKTAPSTLKHDSSDSSMSESDDDTNGKDKGKSKSKAVTSKLDQTEFPTMVDDPWADILNGSSGVGEDQAGVATAAAASPFAPLLDMEEDDPFLELANTVHPVNETNDLLSWMSEIEEEECLPISDKSSDSEASQVGSLVRTMERSGLPYCDTAKMLVSTLEWNTGSFLSPYCIDSTTGSCMERDDRFLQMLSYSEL